MSLYGAERRRRAADGSKRERDARGMVAPVYKADYPPAWARFFVQEGDEEEVYRRAGDIVCSLARDRFLDEVNAAADAGCKSWARIAAVAAATLDEK